MIIKRNLIAGERVGRDETAPEVNPSDTRDVVGLYARASRAQAADVTAV